MDSATQTISETSFPFVAFKIHEEDYCIASNVVSQMIIQTEINAMPNNPPYLSGIINVRGVIYPIIDLRILFNIALLENDLDSFALMKNSAVEFINELGRSVDKDVVFTSSKDPKQCAFGQWIHNFKTDNETLLNILNKIDEAHIEMCNHANVALKCNDNNDKTGANKSYELARAVCNNSVVPLMDQLINSYKTLNRGMIILVEEGTSHLGLAVDNVTSIEGFEGCVVDNSSLQFAKNEFIKNLIVAHDDRIFLELNLAALFNLQQKFDLE